MTTTKAIADENATIELSQLRSEVMRVKKQSAEITAAKAVRQEKLPIIDLLLLLPSHLSSLPH